VVFQTFHLLPGFSALENVLMGMMFGSLPTGEHESRAHELLQSLGMLQEEQDVASLSVGQQQRVAVARALACRPALVLADEPTASLDPQNAALALDLLQGACRAAGAALLCTSHDPIIRSRFTRIESMESFVRQVQNVESP
jgi:putative ABC transport system ATP-binding protein